MKERLEYPIRVMPDELRPLPSGVDLFEGCTLWLLQTTLARGDRSPAPGLNWYNTRCDDHIRGEAMSSRDSLVAVLQ